MLVDLGVDDEEDDDGDDGCPTSFFFVSVFNGVFSGQAFATDSGLDEGGLTTSSFFLTYIRINKGRQ